MDEVRKLVKDQTTKATVAGRDSVEGNKDMRGSESKIQKSKILKRSKTDKDAVSAKTAAEVTAEVTAEVAAEVAESVKKLDQEN